MTVAENKEVVRRYFEEFNYGRLREDDPRAPELKAICTEDYTMHSNRAGAYSERSGFDQFRTSVANMFKTWSELSFELHELLGDGDKVVARFVIHGTIAGDFRGHPAAGKQVHFSGNNIIDVRDGRIAGEWIYEDFQSVLQQIGALAG